MMLGFISLILIVIEDHLAEICGKHLGQGISGADVGFVLSE